MTDIEQSIKIVCLESQEDLDLFFVSINEYNPIYVGLYEKLRKLFELITYPITVVCEFEYVDKIYRDTFYHYFSAQHNEYCRNCKRLALFKGIIKEEVLYSYSDDNEKCLQGVFIGVLVLKPLDVGKIGRTLLNPIFLNLQKSSLRLTKFNVVVLGHYLEVEAFPHSSQDAETMTCTETTVWSIIEYYGTRYSEYRTILPSEIYQEVAKNSNERVWPSRGLTYSSVSELFMTFGFYPRIYALSAYGFVEDIDVYKYNIEYKRIFHYYVESGIPIAVGIKADEPEQIEHSVVCIGHCESKRDIHDINKVNIEGFPYVDAADYYDNYVIIDDNYLPYTVDNYYDMRNYPNGYIDKFVVPLYKRILMESTDARIIVEQLLKFEGDNFNSYLQRYYRDIFQDNEQINEGNPIVVRLFLTSSRKFKRFRAKNAKTMQEAAFYVSMQYPKFLWIAEITTHNGYNNGKVYGEIVLDATSVVSRGSQSYEKCVLMIRYFSHIGYELTDGLKEYKEENGGSQNVFYTKFETIIEDLEIEQEWLKESFAMYYNNLQIIGNDNSNEEE